MKAAFSFPTFRYGLVLVLGLLALVGFTLKGHPEATQISSQTAPNPLNGAWRLTKTTETGRTAPNVVKIIADGSFTVADYNLNDKKFISAQGGTFTTAKNQYTEKLEYNTVDSTGVGSTLTYNFVPKGNTLTLTTTKNGKPVTETWQRIDSGDGNLAGAWRIRERETQPGQMSVMQRGPRKTIKWLSNNRFQWAAINTETKQFFGTGGGTITLKDGKYTEHIEFFSRDAKRVGMDVTFDYAVKNGDWHHSGLSTAGNKIYEIWAREK